MTPDPAERLGAAMLVCGLVRQSAVDAIHDLDDVLLLTRDQWDAWRALEDEDIALAHACLTVQFEARQREFEALERFGAAWSSGTGSTPQERVASMPAEAACEALLAAMTLGWDVSLPEEA